MRIAIDCRLWYRGGVGRYIRNLIHSILQIATNHEFILIVPNKSVVKKNQYDSTINLIVDSSSMYGMMEHTIFLRLLKYDINLFHSTFQYLPKFLQVPTVVTIHDIMRLKNPQWSYTNLEFIKRYGTMRFLQMVICTALCFNHISKENLHSCLSSKHSARRGFTPQTRKIFKFHHAYQWVATSHSIRDAKKIITPSFNSKEDLLSIMGLNKERISVIPMAPDPKFRPICDSHLLKDLLIRYGIPERFALYVGSWLPNKNIKTLLLAFQDMLRHGYYEYSLVLVSGLDDPRSKALLETVNKINQDKKSIIILENVPDDDLVFLYNAARFTITLSLYEGFCFPIIESMACGSPVIASSRSAIPEVAQGAAFLVNPENLFEIVEAMNLFFDNVGNIQEEYRQRGLRRAKEFNWMNSAYQTLEIYESSLVPKL